MKKVLILGASGLVGRALVNELKDNYNVYGTYFSKEPFSNKMILFDVNQPLTMREILKELKPEIVISCLRGGFDKQLEVHRIVAQYLKEINGKLYFCSTTNVFDNDVIKPHYEVDEPNAKSDYGKFKAQCEKEIQQLLKDDAIILRLPGIWGKEARRWTELEDKLKNNEEIEVYDNVYMSINTDYMLAKQVFYIIENHLLGIFHLATTDIQNYKEFILELISKMSTSHPIIKVTQLPVKKYYLALAAKRNIFPEGYTISHRDVIKYLTNEN